MMLIKFPNFSNASSSRLSANPLIDGPTTRHGTTTSSLSVSHPEIPIATLSLRNSSVFLGR
ncbi:uncharacterized protein K441DRAFT_663756 [Cenococcum geophilum 1.58]|uniref:uncharacterized protein n=1 Tax=Cenococcum geophilum 1.58 TaxID=794803 RepID=UPI00358ECD39|nr:hypothetical protein K441DRAFT_663756 [Cenococcum geophilum 1.58]